MEDVALPEQLTRDAGSFRDPSGYVFLSETAAYRSVNGSALPNYEQVEASGLIQALVDRHLVIQSERVSGTPARTDLIGPRGDTALLILRHPKIPFISYPYEWTFGQLQAAALAHLDIQLTALERNVVLSDATPYNMQWLPEGPCHIDILSFRPYRDGEPWVAYAQFCQLFLFPLMIEAWRGIAFQPILKAHLDGISAADMAQILSPRRKWLTLGGLVHVTLQARLEKTYSSRTGTEKLEAQPKRLSTPTLTKRQYKAMLSEMRALICSLKSGRPRRTYWDSYDGINSYTDKMQSTKRAFVTRYVERNVVRTLWDLGGNSGDYSIAALGAGAYHSIVMDTDLDALERAYQRSLKTPGLMPLVIDCADPSPSRGWNNLERKSLSDRRGADGVLALALVHHLAIGRNIPLGAVVSWIISLAPSGIIEFIPKSDPMLQQMMRNREDIFGDYHENSFREEIQKLASITDEFRFRENGRLLISFQRR